MEEFQGDSMEKEEDSEPILDMQMLKKKIGELEREFKSSAPDYLEITHKLKCWMDMVKERRFGAPEAQQEFLKTHFPKIIVALTKRMDLSDEDMGTHFCLFFRDVLEFAMRMLDQDRVEITELISKILSPALFSESQSLKAYSPAASELSDEDSESETLDFVESEDASYAKPPAEQPMECSALLFELIDEFGRHGGFRALMNRLKKTDPKPSFAMIKFCIKPFHKIRWMLRGKVIRSYAAEIQTVVIPTILSVTNEELKNESKQALADIAMMLQGLLETFLPPAQAEEAILRLVLEMAHRCLTLDASLEKRLAGLADIREAIMLVHKKHDACQKAYAGAQQEAKQVFETVKSMVQSFILERKIVETLFGDSMHMELLKRSSPVLIFLSQAQVLEKRHIDIVWESTTGKHESLQHAMHQIAIELFPWLREPDAAHLYEHIRRLPHAEYNQSLVNLLVETSRSGIEATAAKTDRPVPQGYFGVDILWHIAQENSGAPSDIAGLAFNSFLEFLCWPKCSGLIQHYLIEAFKKLEEGVSTVLAVITVQRIINTFPQKKRRESAHTIETVISLCETQFKMMQTFLDAVVGYKARVEDCIRKQESIPRPVGSANATAGPLTDAEKSAVTVGSHFRHDQAVDTFLKFVGFVLENSNLTLSSSHMDILWECLSVRAVNPAERDLFFRWVNEPIQSEVLTPENSEQLFGKLLTLDFANLTQQGLHALWKLFQSVNFYRHQLIVDKQQILYRTDLTGVDGIWNAVLLPHDPAVAKEAAPMLIAVYRNLHPDVAHRQKERRREFLSLCMRHLSSATSQLGKPTTSPQDQADGKLKAERCLALLKALLDDFEKQLIERKGTPLQRHCMTAKSTPCVVCVQIVGGAKFDLTLSSTDTIGLLKQRIVEKSGDKSPASIRLIAAGKEFKEDQKRLCDCGFGEKTNVHVARRPNATGAAEAQAPAVESAQEDDNVEDFPSSILCHPSNFDQLFALLSVDDSIEEKVWELIMLLPTNPRMMSLLRNLTPTSQEGASSAAEPASSALDWPTLLDASSSFRLLYSLQIVEILIQGNEAVWPDPSERAQWYAKFQQMGGLRHLLHVLLSWDTSDLRTRNNAKNKQCLALLLKITNLFVLETISQSASGCVPLSEYEVPLPTVLRKLFEIIEAAALPFEARAEDAQVVEGCVQLLVNSCGASEQWTTAFCEAPNFTEWLQTVLFRSIDKASRESIARGVLDLCNSPLLRPRIFRILLDFLPSSRAHQQSCEEYFTILNSLLSDAFGQQPSGPSEELGPLLDLVIRMIKEQPIVETRNSVDEDQLLKGLLYAASILLTADPSRKLAAGAPSGGNLIHELFWNCLFSTPTVTDHSAHAPPKCKARASRKLAFNLLTVLTRDCPENFAQLTALLLEQNVGGEKRSSWVYVPKLMEKSSTGYVGLRNLGATCYMNSLLQQLYMIPTLRYALFTIPLPALPDSKISAAAEKEGDSSSEEEEDPRAESLMYQLQSLLGNLQESEKRYYDTRDLCAAYKDYDGNPMNTSLQMDVDEFFNMLFDKLENGLKGTEQADILKRLFGGTVANQLICKDCPHLSERDESFYTLSLEIKSKKSVKESLDLYVQGEMLEGDNKYHCSTCSKKVDALKRVCVKSLPNTLILHLKRFEFDFDTMRKYKLNDLFEFPTNLNMEPFTKEGLAKREAEAKGEAPPLEHKSPEYYDYELTGILVHTGTADSGHYYSFIREREPLDGTERKWMCFNDSNVEQMDPKDIPHLCFGGMETTMVYDAQLGKQVPRVGAKPYSAYMLFYERKKPDPEATVSSLLSSLRNIPKAVDEGGKVHPSALVPEPIFKSVWDENMTFLKDKNIFDLDYFEFLWDVVHVAEPASLYDYTNPDMSHPAMRTAELATRFVVETLSHAKEKTDLPKWIQFLQTIYSTYRPACLWFLDKMTSDRTWLRHLLLFCTQPTTRQSFADLILHILQCTKALEEPFYLLETPYPEGADSMQQEARPMSQSFLLPHGAEYLLVHPGGAPRSRVLAFMDMYLDMMHEVPIYWRNFSEYFYLIFKFANISPSEREYLVNRHVVARLLDLVLNDQSPFAKNKRPKMGDKLGQPNFLYLAGTLAALVRSCRTVVSEAKGMPPKSFPGTPITLPDEDLAMLDVSGAISRLVSLNVSAEFTTDIVLHLVWENPEASHAVIGMLTSGINKSEFDLLQRYFDVLLPLLKLKDSLHETRVEVTMHSLLEVIQDNIQYRNATSCCIRFLAEVAREVDLAREWLLAHLDKWLESWLLRHPQSQVRQEAEALTMNLVPDARLPPSSIVVTDPTTGTTQTVPLPEPLPRRELSPESMTKLRQLYSALLTLIPVAGTLAKAEAGVSAKDENDVAYNPTVNRLSPLLRMMRFCVRTPHEKQMFTEHWVRFNSLFIAIDTARNETCENKKEATLFLYEVCHDYPPNVDLWCKDATVTLRLVDYWISLRADLIFQEYNNTTLPYFYKVLHMGCLRSDDCLTKIVNHRNIEWALNQMYFDSPDYQPVADALYQILVLACHKNIKHATTGRFFRHVWLDLILQKDKLRTNETNALRLLDLCIAKAEHDVLTFLRHNGLPLVSQSVVTSLSAKVADENVLEHVRHGAELISRVCSHLESMQKEREAEVSSALKAWANRLPLLDAVLSLMANTIPEPLREACLDLVEKICSFDLTGLEKVVECLNAEQNEVSGIKPKGMADEDFIGLRLRNGLRPPNFLEDRKPTTMEQKFFQFSRRVCFMTLMKLQHNKEMVESAVSLCVLHALETMRYGELHNDMLDIPRQVVKQKHLMADLMLNHANVPDYVERVFVDEPNVISQKFVSEFVSSVLPKAVEKLSAERLVRSSVKRIEQTLSSAASTSESRRESLLIDISNRLTCLGLLSRVESARAALLTHASPILNSLKELLASDLFKGQQVAVNKVNQQVQQILNSSSAPVPSSPQQSTTMESPKQA